MVRANFKFTTKTLLIVLAVSVVGILTSTSTAHADNRLPRNSAEISARNLCNTGPQAPYARRGAIWLSNSSSYYDAEVTVPTSATSVTVYIRGSVYNCQSAVTGATYAVNVAPGTAGSSWRLGSLSSTSLARGVSTGATNWSTQGGQITAQLNVNGVASPGGQATIQIYLYRCFSTNPNSATGTCYQELVPIVVRRNAAAYNYAQCEIFSWPGFPSAQSGQDVAVANTGNTIINNVTVSPGDTVHIGIRFKNTGTTTWTTDDSDRQRYGAFYSGDYLDDVHMRRINSADMPSGLPFPVDDNVILPDGRLFRRVYPRVNVNIPPNTSGTAGSTVFWFALELPDDFSGSSLKAAWQMAQFNNYQGRSSSRFGEQCSIVFRFERNRPYLSVAGGDVYSGARFGESCFVTARARAADIITNGFSNSTDSLGPDNNRGSSRAQYAVFSSGLISNVVNSNFFGNNGYSPPSGNRREMLFAHEDSELPGFFYGYNDEDRNFSAMPCVNESSSEASTSGSAVSHIQSGEGRLRVAGDLTLNSAITGITGRKTLYVDGNLTITGSLRYQTNYPSVGEIPYLKIVARNIYIQANAVIIDGHLVAQPGGTASAPTGGIIDTCSNAGGGTAGSWPTSMTTTFCRRTSPSFVVNGSMTARRVLWKRTYGTVGSSSEVYDNECLYSSNQTGCSAEYINFNPEALISGMGGTRGISSVPLSTIELSPIY